MVAMIWHYKLNTGQIKPYRAKIKSLVVAMFSEPVNLFIITALVVIGFGVRMNTLPVVASNVLQRLSLLMTPLVLLYIGLAIKVQHKQFMQIALILLLRGGFVMLFSGIFVLISGIGVVEYILLILAFSLSASSFWPFAHISVVAEMEVNVPF